MKSDEARSHVSAEVKRRSPARFVAALFAPEAKRRSLLALYGLDAELTHIPEAVREPMIATIRYQWWRDAMARLPEPSRGHPVLDELSAAISAGDLSPDALLPLIDAREAKTGEAQLVALAARVLSGDTRSGALADAVGAALASRDKAKLTEARRLWRAERRTRKAELPAYLPATFVDAPHPVTQFRLYGRALRMAVMNRF